MRLVAPLRERVLVHIDLHETTDTDESEFRPALAARDGKPFEPGTIPDGFYLVANSENRQLPFQEAVIAAVAKVTHIAAPDQERPVDRIRRDRAGRDRVRRARARLVYGHHRRSLYDDHGSLSRQPACEPGAM